MSAAKRLIAVWLLVLVLAAAGGRLALGQATSGLQELRSGARGEPVRRLQVLLKSLKYDPGPMDGIFGRQTELALRRYQRDRGLTVDGILGRQTLAALERDWKALQTPPSVPVNSGRMHTVRPGETLHTIALLYNLTWMDLMEFNHLRDPNRVMVGQALFIPDETWQPGQPPITPVAEPERWVVVPRPVAGAVALTFNDSPHPSYTLAILEVLAQHQVTATFFVIGSLAERNPDLVRLISERGHEVANHSFSHQSLRGQPLKVIEEEISKTSQLVQSITGSPTTVFRPPGGGFDQNVRMAAARQDHRMVMWTNIGAHTPASVPVSELAQRIIDHAYDGSIIMLHDGCKDTLDVLSEVIIGLKAKDFVFVTLSGALQAVFLGGANH
ncbi:MAG: polysaccharide deacetylase family protein [Bacillota bacterium]